MFKDVYTCHRGRDPRINITSRCWIHEKWRSSRTPHEMLSCVHVNSLIARTLVLNMGGGPVGLPMQCCHACIYTCFLWEHNDHGPSRNMPTLVADTAGVKGIHLLADAWMWGALT